MTDQNHQDPQRQVIREADASQWALPPRVVIDTVRATARGAPHAHSRNAGNWLFIPLALSALLLASSIISETPLERLDGGGAIGNDIHLNLSPAYLALDPFCRLLDSLSLLTLVQLIALWSTLIVCAAGYGAWSARGRSASYQWRQAGIWAAASISVVLAICAAGTLLPRPMAALAVESPDIVTIDFHSHTSASHDGRHGFGAEANRAWHAAGGFNVAYLSDHANWDAVAAAEKMNPALAGAGTMLLSAVEVRLGRYYVIALGPEAKYESALNGNWLKDDAPYTATRRSLIYTLPMPQQALQSGIAPRLEDASAIEVCDAGPRGLMQSRTYRDTLLHWAGQMNVPVVASSNNHGWGRTAACWTLMDIPGWRQLDQQRLSRAIERHLRQGRQATSVVAMRPPAGDLRAWGTLATAPMLTMHLLKSLSVAERWIWIAYIWGIAFMQRKWRQIRSQTKSRAIQIAAL